LVFLVFMPIVTAELLTGSTPLYSLVLNPPTLPLLVGLYGAGALIVRELGAVWRKGWPTILVLGAAYGVIEEALDTKSWFNPAWSALGPLGSYGRYLGVNWIWAFQLTFFHAVFSIAIPIALTTVLFPGAGVAGSGAARWLSDKKLAVVTVVFVADVLLGFEFWPYSTPISLIVFGLWLVAVLISIAYLLPKSPVGSPPTTLRGRALVGIGFLSCLCLFLISWVGAGAVPPLADLALFALEAIIVARFLVRNHLSGKQVFYLAAGALGFLIAIPIVQLNVAAGNVFVAAAYLIGLVALARRLNARAPAVVPFGGLRSENPAKC
jgi:hypothetical protein